MRTATLVGVFVCATLVMPPALSQVITDSAGRAAGHQYYRRGVPWTWTCDDVRRAIAEIGSVERAEAAARAVGTGDMQIEIAKRCLKKAGR